MNKMNKKMKIDRRKLRPLCIYQYKKSTHKIQESTVPNKQDFPLMASATAGTFSIIQRNFSALKYGWIGSPHSSCRQSFFPFPFPLMRDAARSAVRLSSHTVAPKKKNKHSTHPSCQIHIEKTSQFL